MIRLAKIILLKWKRFWLCIAVEIDEQAIAAHAPSLERNRTRLAHLEFELDQLYRPESIIMQALRRKS